MVFSIVTLDKLKIDDPVGAISVHGTVGIFGIFAVLLSDPDATFMGQMVGMLTIFGWVFGASFVAWMAIKTVMGIRVTAAEEERGHGHGRLRDGGIPRIYQPLMVYMLNSKKALARALFLPNW